MTEHTTLSALEDAHDREASAARDRIEQAEEHIHYYRSQMIRLQEHFYEVARSAGVQDDPRFQYELRRVTTQIDDNVRAATRVVIRFDDELTELTARHRREHEDLQERLRKDRAAQ